MTARQLSRDEVLALPPVITLETLGRVLGVSNPVVRRLNASGELGIRVDRLGQQWRVVTASVWAYGEGESSASQGRLVWSAEYQEHDCGEAEKRCGPVGAERRADHSHDAHASGTGLRSQGTVYGEPSGPNRQSSGCGRSARAVRLGTGCAA